MAYDAINAIIGIEKKAQEIIAPASKAQAEFDEIAERNQGNRAMNAALRSYAEMAKLRYVAGEDTDRAVEIVNEIARQAKASIYSGSAFDANIAERWRGSTSF